MINRALIISMILLLAGCASKSNDRYSNTNDFNELEAAKTRVSLGLTYLQNGNYQQAKINLDRALNYAPRLGDAHFAMAYYYQTISEFELADQYYQQALSLDKNNADLMNSYGTFLCLQGNYREAEAFMLRAINSKQYANTAETYENLAICRHSQADIEKAIDYLGIALQHQPGRAKSWYMLIELLIAKQRWQEAKIAFRQYEKVVPVTSDTLAIAIEIENGLGNYDVARGYQQMLKNLYPDRANLQRTQLLPVSTSDEIDEATDIPIGPSTEPEVHIVQKGENLYRIALKYKVRIQWLIEWNNISDASELKVGQSIYVSDPNT